METTTYIVLVIIVALAALIFIPRWMISRAIKKVIKIFRYHSAINEKNARTAGELGLTPPTFMQRMSRTRDYKPQALNILIKAEIIKTTDDGRLYLSEDRLATTRLAQQ